jgi:hypothetical protein
LRYGNENEDETEEFEMLVALHRGEGFIARAIQWQTRSGYSHASVLLEAAELVIEAREFQGVRIVPWAEVMASGERVDLFRVAGLTEEQEIAVREFLWDQIGKPYDYTMVARFISRRQEERTSSGKWFCSELVFAAFAQAGVKLLERIEPWAVSPGMLSLSPLLEMKNEEPKFGLQRMKKGEMGNVQRPTLNFQRSEEVGQSLLTSAATWRKEGNAGEGVCPTTEKEGEHVR